jgi:hypothetical protein
MRMQPRSEIELIKIPVNEILLYLEAIKTAAIAKIHAAIPLGI